MKINRYGQSKILTPQEIDLLFNQGLTNERDRTLFAVCLFSACRIAEACTLFTEDVYNRAGEVRPVLIVRKNHTKGKPPFTDPSDKNLDLSSITDEIPKKTVRDYEL